MTPQQYRELRKKLFGGSMDVMARRLGISSQSVKSKECRRRPIARRDVRLLEFYVYMLDTAETKGKTIDDALRAAKDILTSILEEPYSED
jgi:hypothetical protein